MDTVARKIVRLLPGMPRKRYNVFAGTHTVREWLQMAKLLLTRGHGNPELVEQYERQFAARCGSTDAISFGAGRMAFYAILEALGIGAGDEVIIPAFTCVVVPNAILYREARPVYVDIDPRTFNIDVAQVEGAITPRTRALYAQHTFGVPCDVDALRHLARRHGLPLIEDAAHALGGSSGGRPVGSLGDVAFFSTDHSKMTSTQVGGMVVTSRADLARRLRQIQQAAPELAPYQVRRVIAGFLAEFVLFSPALLWCSAGLHVLLSRLGLVFTFNDELLTDKPSTYPYPCRLSPAQAQMGISQLEDLPRNLAHRREIALELESRLQWYGGDPAPLKECAWLRYSFLVRSRAMVEDALRTRFDLGVWFTSVVHGRNADLAAVGYRAGSCPVAEFAARHIVNLPTHSRVPVGVICRELDRHAAWLRDELIRQVPATAFA